jgi:hypothetical protein
MTAYYNKGLRTRHDESREQVAFLSLVSECRLHIPPAISHKGHAEPGAGVLEVHWRLYWPRKALTDSPQVRWLVLGEFGVGEHGLHLH